METASASRLRRFSKYPMKSWIFIPRKESNVKKQLNEDGIYARYLQLPVSKGTHLVMTGCGGIGPGR